MSKIEKINIGEELRNSYLEYSKSFALERSLPDIRDGLKPVQRRIVYSMLQSGNIHSKPYTKCARIVGDVMGKYHPHGDSSIYFAMTNIAQPFNTNIPIIDGQGNFGTIDGDSPAAMRYTEARLTEYAESFAEMLKSGLGEYVDNFDGSLKEPSVIPTLIPNLLVNGSYGIAVGISTSIPSFNLNELIDAAIKLINTPNAQDKTLYSIIKGPDFPCGGSIDASGMTSILKNGKGSFDVYAKLEEKKGNLYITEIPQTYAGNKEGLIVDIINKVNDGRIPEISNVEDQSAEDVLIELKLRRGSNVEQVRAKLYKYTGLKSSYAVNMVATLGDNIVEFNLRNYLSEYIKFAQDSLKNELLYEITNLNKKIKRLETIIFASENIELITEIITKSENINDVKKCLSKGNVSNIKFSLKKYESAAKKLRLNEEEIDIILQIKLSSLVKTDVVKLKEENDRTKSLLLEKESIVNSDDKLNTYLIQNLKRIKKEFGIQRRTEIIEDVKLEKIVEKEVEPEEVYVLIDALGYLKVINRSSFSSVNDLSMYDAYPIMNNDRLAFFYEDGYIRYLDIKDLKVENISAKGEAIDSMLDAHNCTYFEVISQSELEKSNILFVSQAGYGKIINGQEYVPTGKALYRKIVGSKLNKDDTYILIKKITDEEFIEVESAERILRFKVDEVSTYGKSARGMILMNKKYLPLIKVRLSDFLSDKIGKRAGAGTIKK